ncbi:unnamed protein product [Calypogeia fissa]
MPPSPQSKFLSSINCGSSNIVCVRVRFAIMLWLVIVQSVVEANSEGDALHAFKENLNDPGGVLASWDPSLVNPCTWFHVTCNNNNNVIRVDLGNASLSGGLVPELGNLANLEYLELFANSLSGKIPEELGQLSQLISLDLYENTFTGSLPESLGQLHNLKYLRLDHNFLTGDIPLELTVIPSLLVVKLSYNNLTGVVPQFASSVDTFFEDNPYLLS